MNLYLLTFQSQKENSKTSTLTHNQSPSTLDSTIEEEPEAAAAAACCSSCLTRFSMSLIRVLATFVTSTATAKIQNRTQIAKRTIVSKEKEGERKYQQLYRWSIARGWSHRGSSHPTSRTNLLLVWTSTPIKSEESHNLYGFGGFLDGGMRLKIDGGCSSRRRRGQVEI